MCLAISSSRRTPRAAGAIALTLALASAYSPSAAARARGLAVDSCEGCHGGGASAQVTLTSDRSSFAPGDALTLTLTITSASIRVGGTFVTTGGVGTLRVLSGEGLAVTGQGLTHTAPKAAQNGAVTFRFGWQAPATPGNVSFRVAALSANGNNTTLGDGAGAGIFEWVYGCTGRTYIQDNDRDGYGARGSGTMLACDAATAPLGFAAMEGDCDDNDETAHPGATEICNQRDDNCDGAIDENAPAVMLWPDGDGDGYYRAQSGTPKIGCGGVPGYAAAPGDCNDFDPAVNPGAKEVCNLKDDNCDGRADERVRPQCGFGWCRRDSPTCEAIDCRPGEPNAETCNQFDDDCDGEIDNDACGAGMVCMASACVPAGAADGGGGGGGGTWDAGGGDSGVPPSASGNGGAPGGYAGTAVGCGGCDIVAAARSPYGAGVALALAIATLALRRRRRR